MNDSTRSRRIRQRPRTKKIHRHQDQPLLWPERAQPRPVFRQRQVRLEVEQRGQVTPYGGLALAHQLAMRLELDKDLNRALPLLKIKLPYFESDQVLTHAYNLYAGGGCIEDIANLQHSDALKHLLGACRIPDPSTAGDFLRRLHEPHLTALQGVIDAAREKAWKQLPRARRQTGTMEPGLDHQRGARRVQAGGRLQLQREVVLPSSAGYPGRDPGTPADDQSFGNAASADGAVAVLHGVLPMVKRHFDEVRVRGDSKFYQHGIIAAGRQHGARFAVCMDPYTVLQEKADALPPPGVEALLRSSA